MTIIKVKTYIDGVEKIINGSPDDVVTIHLTPIQITLEEYKEFEKWCPNWKSIQLINYIHNHIEVGDIIAEFSDMNGKDIYDFEFVDNE